MEVDDIQQPYLQPHVFRNEITRGQYHDVLLRYLATMEFDYLGNL